MSNNFRVGQKVVAVGREWHTIVGWLPADVPNPVYGRIYTVSEVDWPTTVNRATIGLVEFSALQRQFTASDFRPAVERGEETGMAILRKLLTDNTVDEHA